MKKALEIILEKMSFLSEAENRESFFRRIASFLAPLDPRYLAIEKAYNYAKDAFRDLERESGDRYFEHLRAVALILVVYLRIKDHTLIIAALLHDIVEDIPSWTIERVRLEFSDEVALLVSYLTKPSAKDFPLLSSEGRVEIYHDRFAFAPRGFFLVKMADRFHNLVTMWKSSPEKINRKIEETISHYLPYAEKQLIMLHELEAVLENLKETSQ